MPEQQNVGKVIEIKGVVIDAAFTEQLPEIYNAFKIELPAEDGTGLWPQPTQERIGAGA